MNLLFAVIIKKEKLNTKQLLIALTAFKCPVLTASDKTLLTVPSDLTSSIQGLPSCSDKSAIFWCL